MYHCIMKQKLLSMHPLLCACSVPFALCDPLLRVGVGRGQWCPGTPQQPDAQSGVFLPPLQLWLANCEWFWLGQILRGSAFQVCTLCDLLEHRDFCMEGGRGGEGRREGGEGVRGV